MDSFGAIPVFVTVIEAGGFSPAAKQLGISKSAVSKRVSQLEDELGVKLLHRTTRKLSLTEAGEHYYQHARVAHHAGKNAYDAVAQLQGEPRGLLKINSPMSFGRLHIAPLIPKFLERYQQINIDLVMEDRVADLIAGGFDIAIRGGDLPDSNLVARKLCPIRNALCVSPNYLEKHGRPQQLDELRQHNCLIFTHSNDVKEWVFVKEGEKRGIEINGHYRVNNSEALREAVLQGLGIARLPTFVAGEDLKNGRLIALFDEYEMPQKAMYAVFPERQYLPSKVRVFIDFLVDYLGGDTPYWDA